MHSPVQTCKRTDRADRTNRAKCQGEGAIPAYSERLKPAPVLGLHALHAVHTFPLCTFVRESTNHLEGGRDMNETMQLIDTHKVQPGDHVEVVGMGGRWFEVINTDDPALIRVRTDSGREFSAGRVCITQARHVDGSFLEGGHDESAH